MKHKILLIEDNVLLSQVQKEWLEKSGYDVVTAMTEPTARVVIQKQPLDLILSDVRLPEGNGIALLEWLNRKKIQIPFVITTDYASFSDAVHAIKLGAKDYLPKPIYKERLLDLVREFLKPLSVIRRDKMILRRISPKAKEVERLALLAAPSDISVMILGANGTGKESVAQSIHQNSDRHDYPFIAVNCGGIPKELAASYFFGHIKGAFTGADKDKKGYFEIAKGGTLFLDEVGNMSLELQAMLLRVLQEHTYSPVGGHQEQRADVRIISATNEDLKLAISEGRFREDFFHRLCEFDLWMPSLSECREDILPFAEFFREQYAKEYRKEAMGFSDESKEFLLSHPWSGNIRELKNRIKRAIIIAQNEYLSVADLGFDKENAAAVNLRSASAIMKFKDEERDKEQIILALQKSGNNITRAARLLGISRQALHAKLKKYDLK